MSLMPIIPQVFSSPPPSVEYLLAAAGAAGGPGYVGGVCGGGAGAGEVKTGSLAVTAGVSNTITIGKGGAWAYNTTPSSACNGENSVFSSITALGGGRGGGMKYPTTYAPEAGGSAGGGMSFYNPANVGATASGTGNDGGDGVSGGFASGGGGGEDGPGGDGSGTGPTGGAAGAGLTSTITGSSVEYGKGGSGKAYPTDADGAGANGAANTGNGGDGAVSGYDGGHGADGVAIIRYSNEYTTPTSITGTYTDISYGAYRCYKFTGNGSITF